jgi:hypothetical protein
MEKLPIEITRLTCFPVNHINDAICNISQRGIHGYVRMRCKGRALAFVLTKCPSGLHDQVQPSVKGSFSFLPEKNLHHHTLRYERQRVKN